MGYSLWGHNELDTTEHARARVHTHTHTHTHTQSITRFYCPLFSDKQWNLVVHVYRTTPSLDSTGNKNRPWSFYYTC